MSRGSEDFDWDPSSFSSELGRRIARSTVSEMVDLRRDVGNCWRRFPEQHRTSLTNRLKERDHHFRAALWELYWFNACRQMAGQDPAVEWSNVVGAGKSVDFYSSQFGPGTAIEVACLSDRNVEVLQTFYMADLMDAAQRAVLAPNHHLFIRVVKWTERLPDIDSIVGHMRDWALDDLWSANPEDPQPGRLRLVLDGSDWALTIEAIPTAQRLDSTSLSWVGQGSLINLGERIRDRLNARAAKSSALTQVPFVIAIGETGGFVGSARWHRIGALYGADEVHIRDDGSVQRGRGDDGFLLGSTGWRHPEVSAVAFTGQKLPDFSKVQVEWWLNGAADNPLDPALLSRWGDVVAIREGVLQCRQRGTDEWTAAEVE